ncbi:MAG: hypothetical protein KAJ29_00515 [Alphaproteobacteria bacterium]|nr:hypothetical protein [Alphaproteobacteria bacterium]
MNIQSSLHTDMSLSRDNVALSAVKQNIDQAQQMQKMAQQTTQSAPINETRGTLLDILV